MPEKKLKASIIIGGMLDGSFTGALNKTVTGVDQLKEALRRAQKQNKELEKSFHQAFRSTDGNLVTAREKMLLLARATEKASVAQERLNKATRIQEHLSIRADRVQGVRDKASQFVTAARPGAPGSAGLLGYFEGKGWSKAQAAGIVANINRESSGGDPQASGDNGNAYGIGQWHPGRQARFKKLFGKDIHKSFLQEQLQFYDWELRNSEKPAGDRLKKAKTAAEAAGIVSQYFERPHNVQGEMAFRSRQAELILAGSVGAARARPVIQAAAPGTAPAKGGVNVTMHVEHVSVHANNAQHFKDSMAQHGLAMSQTAIQHNSGQI